MSDACQQRVQEGNLVRVTGTFTNALDDYNPVDPSQVFVYIRDPLGNESTYQYIVDPEVQRDGVGIYYTEVSVTESGNWYFRWYSLTSGVEQSSTEITLTVLATLT